MNQVSSRDVLLAIKSDNLVLFADLFKDYKNIALGRFPMLSLCILYKAKKIMKKYQQSLLGIREYKVIDEPREVYARFKTFAGKALRLYINEDSLVSPLEMLAIMNRTRKLKKLYPKFASNETLRNRLKAIFNINAQNSEVTVSSIKVGQRPWSAYQRRLRVCALCIAIAFVCVLSGSFAFVGLSLGFGTEFNPFKVSTESQLLLALKSDGYYTLTKDISVSGVIDGAFKGNLNGNGFALRVDDISTQGYLLERNNGTIENLKIVYASQELEMTKSVSLFVSNNLGTMRNIDIVCEKLDVDCVKSGIDDVYLSAIATTNSGKIENAKLSWNVDLEATGDGECAVGGMVGHNTGEIDGCVVSVGNITTTETDVAGIVCFNDNEGVVKNCKNYSSLKQSSSSRSWNPNVGGITIMNYGIVDNSYNMGKLEVHSVYDGEESAGSLYAGGISSMNYGTIDHCLSLGDITTTSKRIVSYVGGISGRSYFKDINKQRYYPMISESGVDCVIDVQSEHEKAFVFAGGISGYLFGEMTECYSLATFINGNDDKKYLVGLALGSADYLVTGISVAATNIHVLDVDNVLYHVASLMSEITDFWGNVISIELTIGGDFTNAIHTSQADQIMSQEVYWNAE